MIRQCGPVASEQTGRDGLMTKPPCSDRTSQRRGLGRRATGEARWACPLVVGSCRLSKVVPYQPRGLRSNSNDCVAYDEDEAHSYTRCRRNHYAHFQEQTHSAPKYTLGIYYVTFHVFTICKSVEVSLASRVS